jgi:hypothetical protein
MGSFSDRLVTVICWFCVIDCDVIDMTEKPAPRFRMSVDEPLAATHSLRADRIHRWELRWIRVIAARALSALLPVTAVRADGEAGTRIDTGSAARDPNGPADGCKKGSEDQGFWSRLKDSYTSHLVWNGGELTAPPAMIVGGAEVPESNPPWPYSTWNIGASETIGVDGSGTSSSCAPNFATTMLGTPTPMITRPRPLGRADTHR